MLALSPFSFCSAWYFLRPLLIFLLFSGSLTLPLFTAESLALVSWLSGVLTLFWQANENFLLTSSLFIGLFAFAASDNFFFVSAE